MDTWHARNVLIPGWLCTDIGWQKLCHQLYDLTRSGPAGSEMAHFTSRLDWRLWRLLVTFSCCYTCSSVIGIKDRQKEYERLEAPMSSGANPSPCRRMTSQIWSEAGKVRPPPPNTWHIKPRSEYCSCSTQVALHVTPRFTTCQIGRTWVLDGLLGSNQLEPQCTLLSPGAQRRQCRHQITCRKQQTHHIASVTCTAHHESWIILAPQEASKQKTSSSFDSSMSDSVTVLLWFHGN